MIVIPIWTGILMLIGTASLSAAVTKSADYLILWIKWCRKNRDKEKRRRP